MAASRSSTSMLIEKKPSPRSLNCSAKRPLSPPRRYQLDEGVAHRQPRHLEPGAEGPAEPLGRLQAKVAFPLRRRVLQVVGRDHYVVQLLYLQGSLTSIHRLKRRIVLAEKRVEPGGELAADKGRPEAPPLAAPPVTGRARPRGRPRPTPPPA